MAAYVTFMAANILAPGLFIDTFPYVLHSLFVIYRTVTVGDCFVIFVLCI